MCGGFYFHKSVLFCATEFYGCSKSFLSVFAERMGKERRGERREDAAASREVSGFFGIRVGSWGSVLICVVE